MDKINPPRAIFSFIYSEETLAVLVSTSIFLVNSYLGTGPPSQILKGAQALFKVVDVAIDLVLVNQRCKVVNAVGNPMVKSK